MADRIFNNENDGACPLFKYAIILTKTDKASPKSLSRTVKAIKEEIRHTLPQLKTQQSVKVKIISTSAATKKGADEIWETIFKHC